MNKRVFNRSSWLVLGLFLLLLMLDIAQVAYRLDQPWDGWSISTDSNDNTILANNSLGNPSPLQSGDILISIEGVPVTTMGLTAAVLPQGNWGDLESATYKLLRGGKELNLEVPLYRWTLRAYLTGWANAFTLGAILLLVIGSYVFYKQPQDWGARSLFLFSAGLFLTSLSQGAWSSDFFSPVWLLTGFFSFFIFGVLIFPSFLMLTLCFPKPKRIVQRHPALAMAGIYGATPALIFITGYLSIGWLTVVFFALTGILAVGHTALTSKDATSRAQVRWAVTGVVFGAIAVLLNNLVVLFFLDTVEQMNLPDWSGEIILPIGFLSIALGFAIAILRYRLFDIDVLIRRTLVYSLLTALLALVYFGAVSVLQNLFQAASGQQSPAAIVISTLGIATLFNPLRRRLQEIIDRRFYRQKYDAEQALADFAATARSQADPDQLENALLHVAQDTIQPQHVGLWRKSMGHPKEGR